MTPKPGLCARFSSDTQTANRRKPSAMTSTGATYRPSFIVEPQKAPLSRMSTYCPGRSLLLHNEFSSIVERDHGSRDHGNVGSVYRCLYKRTLVETHHHTRITDRCDRLNVCRRYRLMRWPHLARGSRGQFQKERLYEFQANLRSTEKRFLPG